MSAHYVRTYYRVPARRNGRIRYHGDGRPAGDLALRSAEALLNESIKDSANHVDIRVLASIAGTYAAIAQAPSHRY